MAYGGMMDQSVLPKAGPMIAIELSYHGYLEYLPFFSSDARVVLIQIPFPENIFDVDLPVEFFVWPVPSAGVVIRIHEPDMAGFRLRLEGGGFEFPDLEDPTEELDCAELVVTSPSDGSGTSIPDACPGCLGKNMCTSSFSVLWSITEDFAKKKNLNWVFEPSKSGHGNVYISGKNATVLRCLDCMDTYIRMGKNLVRHVKEEG